MADNERSSRTGISDAIGAHRQVSGMSDRSNLSETLVKSSLWKKETFRKIKDAQTGDNDDVHDPDDRRQSTTLRRSHEEIERLQLIVARLEAENCGLAEKHREEVAGYKKQLNEFEAAYEQFRQESDDLLTELDNDNERLRTECKLNNRRSLL